MRSARVEANQRCGRRGRGSGQAEAPRRRRHLCPARRRLVTWSSTTSRGRRRLRQGVRAGREMGRQAALELQEPGGRGAEAYGAATGDRDVLERAIDAYRADPRIHSRAAKRTATGRSPATTWRWCCRRSASARRTPAASKRRCRFSAIRLHVFEREKDDLNWAAAQNNIGNVLLTLGKRESEPKRLKEAVAAFRAALEKRDRAKVPLDWAASPEQYRHRALFALSEREAGERASDAGRGRLPAGA